MITLTRKDNNAAITLPERLRWLDEHQWSRIAQTEPEYTLGGAVVIQQGTKLAGRPITLGNDDVHNWLPKATVETLREWTDVPELVMTLDYQGRQFDVCWRIHDQAIAATPVGWRHDEGNDAWYHAELRLMTI